MLLSILRVNCILNGGLSAAINGILIEVVSTEDKAIFASSEASRMVDRSARSFSISIPKSSYNLLFTSLTIRASISSPPSLCAPAVESTSKKPDRTESIVTSNVPPPKS